MPRPQPNKINEQTAALRADTAMRTDCDIKWEEEREKRALAARKQASVAALRLWRLVRQAVAVTRVCHLR